MQAFGRNSEGVAGYGLRVAGCGFLFLLTPDTRLRGHSRYGAAKARNLSKIPSS